MRLEAAPGDDGALRLGAGIPGETVRDFGERQRENTLCHGTEEEGLPKSGLKEGDARRSSRGEDLLISAASEYKHFGPNCKIKNKMSNSAFPLSRRV